MRDGHRFSISVMQDDLSNLLQLPETRHQAALAYPLSSHPLTPFLRETTTQSNPHESICCPTLLLAFPSPTHSSCTRSLCGAQAPLAAVPRHAPMCSPEEHTPLAATRGLSTFLFSPTVLTPSCSRGKMSSLKQITHCQRSI